MSVQGRAGDDATGGTRESPRGQRGTQSGPRQRGAQASPRERLVYTCVQHLRAHGVHASGLRTVVADAEAPWGSLRHYFPGGKEQLFAEALDWAGDFAAERVRAYLRTAECPSPAGLFESMTAAWADELVARDYERGCPVAAAVVDSAEGSTVLRESSARALETWRQPLVAALEEFGATAERASDLATLMLCTLQGALILARAQRSVEPLHVATRTLAPALRIDASTPDEPTTDAPNTRCIHSP